MQLHFFDSTAANLASVPSTTVSSTGDWPGHTVRLSAARWPPGWASRWRVWSSPCCINRRSIPIEQLPRTNRSQSASVRRSRRLFRAESSRSRRTWFLRWPTIFSSFSNNLVIENSQFLKKNFEERKKRDIRATSFPTVFCLLFLFQNFKFEFDWKNVDYW